MNPSSEPAPSGFVKSNRSARRTVAPGWVVAAALALNLSTAAGAQRAAGVDIAVDANGRLTTLGYGAPFSYSVPIHSGNYAGPSFYGHWAGQDRSVTLRKDGDAFVGEEAGFAFRLRYVRKGDLLELHASVRNLGNVIAQPKVIGLRLGIDTDQDTFPRWLEQFFPTFMRTERTHFTGYLMSPNGHILAIASDDPVASWSVLYNDRGERQDLRPAGYLQHWGGHKVRSANVDLISAGPLPARHPQDLYQLRGGEEKHWVFKIAPVAGLDQVPATLSRLSDAPFFAIAETALEPGSASSLMIWTGSPVFVEHQAPSGRKSAMATRPVQGGVKIDFTAAETGLHLIRATDADGHVSEASVYVRKPWSWYLDKARDGAFKYPQRAATHAETWYGLYTMFVANRFLPDAKKAADADAVFNGIYPQLYDLTTNAPIRDQGRVQNHSTMVGVLTDRYIATRDITALKRASDLADLIISKAQAKDGSFRHSFDGSGYGVHYTSVIYIAKSIMELMAEERKLASDSVWKARYDRHYAAAKAAIDDLVRRDGNLETEGEMTFEDGMISCTALQIGMFALLQDDPALRQHYLTSMIRYMDGHESLEQLVIPDARMRGGTMRFWESQYDVFMQPNMFNSPHGWSSWNTYATYYRYLLTGDPAYLIRTMNALGSAMQVIDHDTGRLRWAFVPNPRIDASQVNTATQPASDKFMQHHGNPEDKPSSDFVVGEQYVDMVGDWLTGNVNENDVHEHFKALGEIAIDKAYVVEMPDGRLIAYNAAVRTGRDGSLTIIPAERLVSSVHVNLLKSGRRTANVQFAGGVVSRTVTKGTQWIAAGKDGAGTR